MNSSPADRLLAPAAPRLRGASGNTLHRLAVIGATVLSLGVPASAAAQTGSLTGTVTDAQGAAAPGATVTAQPALGPAATATTDAAGGYMLALEPGIYSVTIALSGFETQRRDGVQVTAGETSVVDAMLPLAAIVEQVDVVGLTPLPGAGADEAFAVAQSIVAHLDRLSDAAAQ